MGTLRGRSGKIVEMLEHLKIRTVDISCVQDTWFSGNSVRLISGKAAECKLFWMGNKKGLGGEGIFLAKRWVDTVIWYKQGTW